MSQSSVSYLWREPGAAKGFRAGVSLHSHTNQSKKTLDFIAEMSTGCWGVLQRAMRWCELRCVERTGIRPDYAKSYWTPPLTPKLAFDLEQQQIEERLRLPAMVSLTDHDDIHAPMLLRNIPAARGIPVSVEWTVPFAETAFHLGVHNLPTARGMERMAAFTAKPTPIVLRAILAELDEMPGVLVVFNHPMWDLYCVGRARHEVLVNDFMVVHGQYIHALELNGLRHWKENREVTELAHGWGQLTISGGDRHGVEPNANVNLTHATCFTEFVHEVRRERVSHVLYMPQYAEPWKHRILQSTLDAIREYPHFPEGSQRWDDRVYHPDSDGEIQPLAKLWIAGRAPVYLRGVLGAVRAMGGGAGLRRAADGVERYRRDAGGDLRRRHLEG